MRRKILLTTIFILLYSCDSERNDMKKLTAKETVLKFVEAINNTNINELENLMTAFEIHGFKILSHERLAHGPLSQHHVVIQRY